MLYIKNIDDGAAIFKALGSELRIRIIKTLLENREMNMGARDHERSAHKPHQKA